jgi:nitronate monooxygenase
MPTNRRDFVRRAALMAAALSGRAIPGASGQPTDLSTPMPTPRAAALMKSFGLKYPIFQAGMGVIAGPELASAVSSAGALGALGLAGVGPVTTPTRIAAVKAATDRPFAVNYLMKSEITTLQLALDAGAPIVQFSWGLPSGDFVAAIRRANAKLGIQVGSAEGAVRAVELGADYIICQGTEAGGHVQASMPLYENLASVIEAAKTTPVIAGGGIASGSAIRRALAAGASGVLMGTRFVATREAFAHVEYKAALSRAKAADSVRSVCFQDGWVNAPHGALRNRTMTEWEAAGCPPPGKRPGEGDTLAISAAGVVRRRYALFMPLRDDVGDRIGEMCMYAGRGVGDIDDVPAAGEVIERLWQECLAAKA